MGKEKFIASAIGGVLLPVFELLYGPGQIVLMAMAALLMFIMLDWLSGWSASRKDKSYVSKYGIDGVFRTFFMLLLPAGGHLLDELFQLPGIIFGLFVAGLLHHTIKSMTANTIRAGWADWIPTSILNLLSKWVESEIEAKISRAMQRLEERGGSTGAGKP